MPNEIIKILSNNNKVVALVKPINRDRFTRSSKDLLHSVALSSLDFHESIQDSHCVEEYARNCSHITEKLNKKWQKKEMAQLMVSTPCLEPNSIGNIKASMKKKLGGDLLGAKRQSKKKLSNRRIK